MLSELYKTNAAKAPKTQTQQLQLKYRQISPTSAEKNPSQVAAIATNGAAELGKSPKNLQRGEMSSLPIEQQQFGNNNGSNTKAMAFHPRIKYMTKHWQTAAAAASVGNKKKETNADANTDTEEEHMENEPVLMTSVRTSVVVPPSPQTDVKPLIHPSTGLVIEPNSVIKPVPTATAIAAALLQQQIRTASLNPNMNNDESVSSKILEKLLRQQREHDSQSRSTDVNEDYDDECDERYNNFDDIHLTEDGKQAAHNYNLAASMPNIFQSSLEGGGAAGPSTSDFHETQKMLLVQAQAHAMRNLEYTLSDYGNGSENQGGDGGMASPNNGSDCSGEQIYECRHCGKRYRWKSTLRRHENVECGGKEPSHQCPYCSYKSKQRGNLGVHVRKHHADLPQLESRRRSKYSQGSEGGDGGGSGGQGGGVGGSKGGGNKGGGNAANGIGRASSGNGSDDSSSKLVIDL